MIITTLFLLHIISGVCAYGAEFFFAKQGKATRVPLLISLSIVFGTLLAVMTPRISSTSVAIHASAYIVPLILVHYVRHKTLAPQHIRILSIASLSLALTALLGY